MKTVLLFMKTPYPEQRTVTPWPYMVVEDTNLAMESTSNELKWICMQWCNDW